MTEGISKNKVCLIVGAGHGIGRELLELALGDRTRTVIAADFSLPYLDKIQTSYSDEINKNLFLKKVDVADFDSIKSLAQDLAYSIGKVDQLVITAGKHTCHPIEDLSPETVEPTLSVNLVGHIYLVRHILPLLNDGGSIVGIGSIAGLVGIPMSSVYSASKFGLEGFYQALKIETQYRKIRVSLLEPGNVNTGFNETGNAFIPKDQSSVTARNYQKVLEGIDSRLGMPPQHVAKFIEDVLNSKNPAVTYTVGANAFKAKWALRILGKDLALKLISRRFGF